MLRKSREMRAEIEKEKENDIESIPVYLEEIDNLKQELEIKELEIEKLMSEHEILSELYDKGVIDEKGKLIQ